jgi:hypothetical protein
MPVSFSKSLVGDVYCPLRLIFSSLSEGLAGGEWMTVMPGCLYEQTTDAFISGFGYWAFVYFFTAGRFGGCKAEVAHKLTGAAETAEVKYFGNNGDCCEGIYAVKAA